MIRFSPLMMVSALLAVALVAGCGSSDEAPPLAHPGSGEDVRITIGNLSDLTGPSSGGMQTVNQSLKDLVQYYNDHGIIEGIRLEVIEYDGQLDADLDIPGYESLRDKGVDLLWTGVPGTPKTLYPVVNTDKMVLFTATGDIETTDPPGYVFNLAALPQHEAYTLLHWLAGNDPDFPEDRPARIGGAGWTDTYSEAFLSGVEAYAAAHPDQYQWEGAYLNQYSFNWGAEVEALKDCDYVYPGSVPTSFIKQYRDAGHTGRIIGTEVQAAFIGLVDDGSLWDEVDGMILIRTARWWNEDDMIVDLARTILNECRPGSAERIIRNGCGYLVVCQSYQMMKIIEDAVNTVGARGFDSEAFYEAAQRFSLTIDGIERYSFTETKRISTNYFGLYEASATSKDLIRVIPEWLPVITSPDS